MIILFNVYLVKVFYQWPIYEIELKIIILEVSCNMRDRILLLLVEINYSKLASFSGIGIEFFNEYV